MPTLAVPREENTGAAGASPWPSVAEPAQWLPGLNIRTLVNQPESRKTRSVRWTNYNPRPYCIFAQLSTYYLEINIYVFSKLRFIFNCTRWTLLTALYRASNIRTLIFLIFQPRDIVIILSPSSPTGLDVSSWKNYSAATERLEHHQNKNYLRLHEG